MTTTKVVFSFIAKHPAMALICGGILLLLLSPAHVSFVEFGWILVGLGVLLQVFWLLTFKRI